MIRILLADDHQILRDGLRSMIANEAGMSVVAEAGDGRQAVRLAKELRPDIVIMDISMPDMNGIDAARKIVRNLPGVKVLALSMHSDRRFILGMLEAGAFGYLIKDCAFNELVSAVRSVALGQIYLSPGIQGIVVQSYLNKEPSVAYAAGGPITPREREVLQLIAEGMSNKQIGVHLGIAGKTADAHRRNIMAKLKMDNVAELTKYAIREGIVDI
jgi:DNA-binding NarL/FixJ family response regulator